jgi:hypothetical protein
VYHLSALCGLIIIHTFGYILIAWIIFILGGIFVIISMSFIEVSMLFVIIIFDHSFWALKMLMEREFWTKVHSSKIAD